MKKKVIRQDEADMSNLTEGKEKDIETRKYILKDIEDATEKIERSRKKAYILKELFTMIGEDGSHDRIEDLTLFCFGAETIMHEIMMDNEEASDILHSPLSDTTRN